MSCQGHFMITLNKVVTNHSWNLRGKFQDPPKPPVAAKSQVFQSCRYKLATRSTTHDTGAWMRLFTNRPINAGDFCSRSRRRRGCADLRCTAAGHRCTLFFNEHPSADSGATSAVTRTTQTLRGCFCTAAAKRCRNSGVMPGGRR